MLRACSVGLILMGAILGLAPGFASAGQVSIIDDVDCFADQFVVLADPSISSLTMRSNLAVAAGVPATQVHIVSAKLGIYNVKLSTFTLGGRPVVRSTIFINPITIRDKLTPMANVAGVNWVEPNYSDYLYATPNDPRFVSQAPYLDTVGIRRAWDYKNSAPGVVVAVLDEGIFTNHTDIQDNFWKNRGERDPNNGIDDDRNGYVDDYYGWDFLYNESDVNPDEFGATDTDTHGTFVAGIIAASGNNGLGVAGVAWRTQIMAVKVAGAANNYNKRASHAALAEGILYAIDNGAHILNYSGGGPADSKVRRLAFDYARIRNVPVVCAAGNTAQDLAVTPIYPAAYPDANIIAVAACDNSGQLASFSNYSTTHVDLAAPGVDLFSTIFDDPSFDDDLVEQPGLYGTYVKPFGEDSSLVYGTSSAAAIVSGGLALLKDRHPNWSTAQLKAKLLASVDRIGNLPTATLSGGRINFTKLVDVPAQTWINQAQSTQLYAYYGYLYAYYGYANQSGSAYAYGAYAYSTYGYYYAAGAAQYINTTGRDAAYIDGYRYYQWLYSYYGCLYAYYGYGQTADTNLYYAFLYDYYAYSLGFADYDNVR